MLQGPPARVVGWVLAVNAVNFCYWPDRGQQRWWTVARGQIAGHDDEALGVMAAFSEAIDNGVGLLDGRWLAQMDAPTLRSLLPPAPGAGELPMLAERAAALAELGRTWLEVGGPLGLLALSKGSAVRFMLEIVRRCPSWEDARVLRGERIRFLKRAQLAASMVYGRLGGHAPAAFTDLDRLSVFADYRLPQLLRAAGVLELSPALAARIDAGELLKEGSEEEAEIRAVTVHLGERIRVALLPRFPGLTAIQVDHLLWRTAVQRQAELPPFHRCRTTAY